MCVAHNVCVVLGLSSVFLVFLLCGNGRKDYHNCFITTAFSITKLIEVDFSVVSIFYSFNDVFC